MGRSRKNKVNEEGEGRIGSGHRGGSTGQESEGIKDSKKNQRGRGRVHVRA